MFYGLLDLSFWGYVIALLVLTHITIMSVTLYLHRYQAHRGLELHPVISHFFRFWLWLTTGMETKQWVAVHRKHHARCETADDPHSPIILGIKKVFWEGAELYKAEARNQQTSDTYGHGTPEDWIERNVYRPYSGKGVILMLIIDLVLFGLPGITIWALQMMWIPLFAAGVVNGIGHYWGYRNFECPDASRNILPLAFFLGGEELHNNHHTYGTSAKFSVKWWEFDLGWSYIQVFKMFGLAKVKRLPPQVTVIKNKTQIDGDTLKALLSDRFQIMAKYSKRVITPIIQEERHKASDAGRALLGKACKLLSREPSLVDEEGKRHIATILENSSTVRLVYQYQQKLHEIWSWTTASQKELMEAIHEWCRQAEATGLDVLRDFAVHLRGYSLAKTPA